jgi:ParB/RepB/Spo0J family partition protein
MPRTPGTARRTTKATAPGAAAIRDAATAITGAGRTRPGVTVDTIVTTEHPLLYIDIDDIVPSPDNPRLELTDLQELQHSIRQHGVLEPLVVGARTPASAPADGDTYPLIFGHRRLAAARLAGVRIVPAVVRADLNADEATVQRLVENLQRVDLTPLEEARGYAALRNRHKMKQTDIAAAVGRNQGHVSKRLALLTLPDAIAVRAGRPVDKGGIPLDVAIDATKLPGAVQVDLVDSTGADSDDGWIGADRFAMAIRSASRTAELEAHRSAALGKLRKAGVTVLNADGDTITAEPVYDRNDGPAPLFWTSMDPDAIAAHVKESCHAAVITTHRTDIDDDDLAFVQLVCTDPASHREGGAAAGGDPATATRKRATKAEKETAARAAALEAAQLTRRDFVRDLVTNGKLPAAATQAFMLRMFLVTSVDLEEFGVDLTSTARLVSAPEGQPAGVPALAAFAGGDKLQRYVLALICDTAEEVTAAALSRIAAGAESWPGAKLTAHLYLGYLTECGYAPTDVERVADIADSDPLGAAQLHACLVESGDLPAPADAGDALEQVPGQPPVVDNRVTCPTCQGVGRSSAGDGTELCAVCDGYGVVDPPAVEAPAAATG